MARAQVDGAGHRSAAIVGRIEPNGDENPQRYVSNPEHNAGWSARWWCNAGKPCKSSNC